MRDVVVRFAPSPTGPLHIGGVRTALFNYLFAKKNNGKFLLRIEDTDQGRFVPGAEDYIREALEWVGLVTDEDPWKGGPRGPYRQSERKAMYKPFADMLIEKGHAYYASDTPEELDAMRERLKNAKVPNPQYNASVRMNMKNSLTLSADEVNARLSNGEAYTVRAKIPRNEEVRFQDLIRGWVQVNSNSLDDKVLFKSDGMPTYHLANIVDDHLMNVTHVIRGEEWLPSAPLHILLYRFFGWEESMPSFAHLPLILRPDGNGKLSKRDGDRLGFPVFPLQWQDPETKEISSGYRERGYFRDAFVNMLALLGWNPGGDQEIFSMEELIEKFSIERVGKSGSKFDADKARWFNQQYLKTSPINELSEGVKAEFIKQGIGYDESKLPAYVNLMKERAVFIADMLEGVYLFQRPQTFDMELLKKKWSSESESQLRDIIAVFEQHLDFRAESLHQVFQDHLMEHKISLGAVLPILRVFLSGQGTGPSVFDMMEFLGRDESIARLNLGLKLSLDVAH